MGFARAQPILRACGDHLYKFDHIAEHAIDFIVFMKEVLDRVRNHLFGGRLVQFKPANLFVASQFVHRIAPARIERAAAMVQPVRNSWFRCSRQ